MTQAETSTPSAAAEQGASRVGRRVGEGVGVRVGIRVAVGAGTVLKLPPCVVVKPVGWMVGVETPRVGVGEGIGVALIRAITVAWTRAVMVASVSDSAVDWLAARVSETTAWTVASRAGGSGVCGAPASPQANAKISKGTKTAPSRFIPVIPTSALVLPIQTRLILFRRGVPAVSLGHFFDKFGQGSTLLDRRFHVSDHHLALLDLVVAQDQREGNLQGVGLA